MRRELTRQPKGHGIFSSKIHLSCHWFISQKRLSTVHRIRVLSQNKVVHQWVTACKSSEVTLFNFSNCIFFRFSVVYKKMARRENLPDVISEFLKAIDEMSNTVLVPHRLLDIPKDSPFPAGKCQCATAKESSLVEPAKELNDSGLYGTYHMLLDIKEELTTGKKTSAEGCFRSHVKVVVESMKYLTWLAKSLTQNYCEEVGSGGEADNLQKNKF